MVNDLDANVMLRPSGVQPGPCSERSLKVRRIIGPSGSSLVQMSTLSPTSFVNAIRLPSGESRQPRPWKGELSENTSPALAGLTSPERVTQTNSYSPGMLAPATYTSVPFCERLYWGIRRVKMTP